MARAPDFRTTAEMYCARISDKYSIRSVRIEAVTLKSEKPTPARTIAPSNNGSTSAPTTPNAFAIGFRTTASE